MTKGVLPPGLAAYMKNKKAKGGKIVGRSSMTLNQGTTAKLAVKKKAPVTTGNIGSFKAGVSSLGQTTGPKHGAQTPAAKATTPSKPASKKVPAKYKAQAS
jgi:hypothetical protein